MTNILALDIATTTGYARGSIAWLSKSQLVPPDAGSIRFGVTGASDNAVFANCLKWLSALLEPQPRPDLLILESMLPPTAKIGATTASVRDRLAGLHGVVRGVAHLRGIYQIAEYSVGDVRAHFLGDRTYKRTWAKRLTMDRCRALGWEVDDEDAADACALWSFAAALIEPKHALELSPLFNRALRAAE